MATSTSPPHLIGGKMVTLKCIIAQSNNHTHSRVLIEELAKKLIVGEKCAQEKS